MTEPRNYKFFGAIQAMRRAAVALALIGAPASLWAQTPQGVYAPGQAAVTGFSGALRPVQIQPGQDPDARTFIDTEGPSLRVIDLRRMGGPPEAQLVGAPKTFSVSDKWIGQVFSVALDDHAPANIYVAASSAYGLSIVAPGPDGQIQRVGLGTPGASFMPGQWGPGGGPGSIWKIDGLTGQVSLFANVVTSGKANSGAALGGLTYDPDTKSFFVADRETGLIHRLGPNGADLGAYDHGLAGLPAIGLPPSPASSGPGVDIASPQFDSARPETWGYAPPERRIFGLAAHEHRLYYAVADGLRIWSVGLNPDGSFGADARIEIAVPPAAGPTEISKIIFGDQGRIYLAERPAPTGAQDFEALSAPAIGRVLRYAVIGVTESKQPIWQTAPDEYSVGFPADFRNDNGGVAIGYSYDMRGDLNLASCGGYLWTTGEQLRSASDPKLAAQLGQKDALAINGLQGNPVWLIRRGDEPPLHSYFIDYADAPPDLSARGHMGDVAILRTCAEQAAQITSGRPTLAEGSQDGPPAQGATPPAIPLKPPSKRACETRVCAPGQPPCPTNYVWILAKGACGSGCALPDILINGKCCSKADLQQGGACASGNPSTNIAKPMCGTTQTAIGPNHECCDNDHIYSGSNGDQLCCAKALTNGKCDQLIPKKPNWPCLNCCASGYVSLNGACCLQSQATKSGKCCPTGQKPSADGATCQPSWHIPKITQCCAAGYVPAGGGTCCAIANLTSSGACCATAVDPKDRQQCPKQLEKKSAPPQPCARGMARDEKGACISQERRATPPPVVIPRTPILPKTCGPNERRDRTGACIPRRQRQIRPPVDVPPPVILRPVVCPPGWVLGPLGKRCWPPRRVMPPRSAPAAPPSLGGGRRISCPPGFAPGPMGMRCQPIRRQ